MYRKIPKSTAKGICRSRSPITMERPRGGEKEAGGPRAPRLRDRLGKAEARAQRTHKQGNQQPRYPLLLDLLDLGLVPRCHSLAHDGECVGMSDGADSGSSQPGQAKEGTDAAHGHNKQEVQVEARTLLQHALLLGDDQPEWGWALADAQGPGASLAQSCLSRAPSQEPPFVFGTCPFRQDEHSFHHGAKPSPRCPPCHSGPLPACTVPFPTNVRGTFYCLWKEFWGRLGGAVS